MAKRFACPRGEIERRDSTKCLRPVQMSNHDTFAQGPDEAQYVSVVPGCDTRQRSVPTKEGIGLPQPSGGRFRFHHFGECLAHGVQLVKALYGRLARNGIASHPPRDSALRRTQQLCEGCSRKRERACNAQELNINRDTHSTSLSVHLARFAFPVGFAQFGLQDLAGAGLGQRRVLEDHLLGALVAGDEAAAVLDELALRR